MDLSVIKRLIPDFVIDNFIMFDQINSLKWEETLDDVSLEEHKMLVLEMTSITDYSLTIRFVDVNSFRFEGNGQITGFYIKDMSANGYEGIVKYEVGDFEENAIGFYCSDIVITKLEKIER